MGQEITNKGNRILELKLSGRFFFFFTLKKVKGKSLKARAEKQESTMYTEHVRLSQLYILRSRTSFK